MRQILSIVTVVLLFIISGIIFWAGLSPSTFFNFWGKYPVVGTTLNKVSVLGTNGIKASLATSSESVTSTSGQVIVKGNTWNVEIALDQAQKENGLSNRKALYTKRGMLFAFNTLDVHPFWMKDMLIPIDMVFFDDHWKIVLIEKDLQPQSFPKTFGDKIKSKFVLEINANETDSSGLKLGDQALFLNK